MFRRHVLPLDERNKEDCVFRAPQISSSSTSVSKKMIKFNGKVENGNAPMELMGLEIFDKVKNRHVEFGKGKKEKAK
jgi:hypothetical protein